MLLKLTVPVDGKFASENVSTKYKLLLHWFIDI